MAFSNSEELSILISDPMVLNNNDINVWNLWERKESR